MRATYSPGGARPRESQARNPQERRFSRHRVRLPSLASEAFAVSTISAVWLVTRASETKK